MLFRRTYGVAILVGLILGALAVIQVASILDVGGVSRVVRPPEAGVGTQCAEGNKDACRKLCAALSDVSTLSCIEHLAAAFPNVVEGGGGSSGGSPSSPAPPPPSGGGGNGQPGPTGPPGSSGPPGQPGPPTPPPPPTTTPDPGGVLHTVCHLNPLGIRVCVRL